MPEVLVITPDFPPEIGGIQTLAQSLVSAFTRYRPRVVAPAMAGASVFDQRLPYPVKRAPPARGGPKFRMLSLNGIGFVEALRRRPDVILSMHIVAGPGALVAGRILGRPVVVYVHAQELSHRPRLAHHVLLRAGAVVAVSRHAGALAERVGTSAGRVHIVYPGVEEPGPELPTRPEAERAVIVVARLEERYKGHDVLLKAIARVRQRVPDVRLHIVGDGSLRGELKSLADRAGIGDRTTFHGRLTDAERDALMLRCSVFAMPSRLDERGAGEGFGIAYLEAGAHGLPVVAGRAAGAVDAVIDGETGLLVDPKDDAAVAEAISSLLLDPERARRMGLVGWRQAHAFSWARAAADVELVLDEVTRL